MNEYPKQVKIGGQVFDIDEVAYSDNSETDLGNSYMGKSLITISDNYKSGGVPVKQSHDSKVNTFYHELTHAILEVMGRFDLNDDETFVCCFGSFLCEAMRSAGAQFPDIDIVKKSKDTQLITD